MFRKIKEELSDMKNAREHMQEVWVSDETNQSCFDDLISLSKRSGAPYKIEGDVNEFVIKTKSYNLLIIIITLVVMGVVSGALINSGELKILPWFLIGYIVFNIVLGALAGTSHDITINNFRKEITIKSNNYIGKYFRDVHRIKFSEFERTDFKHKVIKSNNGPTNYIHRIYILAKKKKIKLLDLPAGPIYFVNHQHFINNFECFIRNGLDSK